MTTTQEAGKKGAEIRNQKLSPDERSEASQKAAQTAKQRYGEDFHAKAGSQSHKNTNPKGE